MTNDMREMIREELFRSIIAGVNQSADAIVAYLRDKRTLEGYGLSPEVADELALFFKRINVDDLKKIVSSVMFSGVHSVLQLCDGIQGFAAESTFHYDLIETQHGRVTDDLSLDFGVFLNKWRK